MTVYLVGAGPGDPELITVRGSQLLSRADVVVFDRLVSHQLLDLAPAGALRIDVGKLPGQDHERRQTEINELLVAHGRLGRSVVRLKGGDPFVFGRGGEEAEALTAAGVSFEVVPGVSSAFAVPAAAGVPVTHRGFSRSVTVVTGHVGDAWGKEGPTGPGSGPDVDWEALARLGGTLVIMMGMQHRGEIANRLITAGRSPRTPVLVVHRGTTPMQNTVRSDLAGLADIELDAPSIIVVGEVAALDLPGGGHLPLNGMTVVVTRAQSQSDSLSWALLRAGARVVSLPVIAIADPSDGGTAMCRAVNLLGQHHYDWIVFSSVNAVNRLVSMLGDTRDVGGARLAAVGDATAAALAAHGLPTDLVPQSSSAEALADAMPPGVQSATMPPGVQSATMPPGVQSATMPPGVQSTAMPPGVQSTAMPPGVQSTAMPPGVQSTANSAPVRTPRGRVLFPRAAEAREVLADRLRSKGWEVDEVEAYRTVAAGPDEGVTEDVLDAASGADVVTFTSPSTVRVYLELSGRRGVPSVVACIGPVTAQAASRAGLHVDVVAEEQSVAGLVRALVAKLGDPDV